MQKNLSPQEIHSIVCGAQRHFGFSLAASTPHPRGAEQLRAWELFASSGGNIFLDPRGVPFKAPQKLTLRTAVLKDLPPAQSYAHLSN